MVNASKGVHKIIVGVDYGTTYTGVSWVDTSKRNFNDVNVICEWSGTTREATNPWKTPSRIAYSAENKGCTSDQWGYQVRPEMKRYSWTKLLLDKRTIPQPNRREQGIMELPFGKTAVQVCADYLRHVYNFVIDVLQRRLSKEVLQITPVEFWFTVPAIWTDEAKSNTRKAAMSAGFGSRPGDEIFLIPEPEAAAIATFKSLALKEDYKYIKPGDGILVCDCGGGTVDLTSYAVTSVAPTLEFEELVVGSGDACGSTLVDRQFLDWMSKKFGQAFENMDPTKRGPGSKFMNSFESSKREFGSDGDRSRKYEINLKIPVGKLDYYDPGDDQVLCTWHDMNGFFDPSIDRILQLVEQQVLLANQNAEGKCQINKLVLVGGFGDSYHLQDQLEKWCKENQIQLSCPENPQAAIVKGAALRGLDGLKSVRKRCRRHYGFSVIRAFREGVDPESDAYYSSWNGQKRCKERMIWQISKGQLIDENTKISKLLRAHNIRPGQEVEVILYECSLDYQPERSYNAGVLRVGTIKMGFDDPISTQLQWETMQNGAFACELELQVLLGRKEGVLCFKAWAQGKELATAEIDYAQTG